jgi:hypothetical protein
MVVVEENKRFDGLMAAVLSTQPTGLASDLFLSSVSLPLASA